MMLKTLVRRGLRPLRVFAGRFVIPERSFTGLHGCINTAASFIAWNQIEGDYLEFGVYRGDSVAAAYHAVCRERRAIDHSASSNPDYVRWRENPPRFFAFDSFQGYPSAANPHADLNPGGLASSEIEFRENIASQDVDLQRVVAVPGFFDLTLTAETKQKLGLKKAALVLIDSALYESAVSVLDFITDLVGQGTIVIFHCWFRYKGSPNHGEQRACREWLARNPHLELIEYWREGPQAVSFVVNMKKPDHDVESVASLRGGK